MGDNKKFIEECLQASNKYRERHQAEPLTLNPEISQISQKWAEYLVFRNKFGHNPNATYNNQTLGENIAMRYTSDRSDYSAIYSVDQWYEEVKNYDFRKSAGPNTGHFTQLVWKDSKEMGIGRAQGANGTWIAVANYYPAGNFIGMFAENVLPSKDGNTSNLFAKSKSQVQSLGGVQKEAGTTRVEVKEEATGSGPNATRKIITTETFTTPDGRTQIRRRQEIKRGETDRRPLQVPQASGGIREDKSKPKGKSTSRKVHQELIGSGPNANIKITTIETITEADGTVHTSKKEEIRPANAEHMKISFF